MAVRGQQVPAQVLTQSRPAGWSYRIGPGLVLADARRRQEAPAAGQVVWIDGGGAFPLGHPTTRLCLDLLRETLDARPGASLVEVGCGTGVLCLAGALWGAEKVTGLDIDPRAVLATRTNARNNGLAEVIQVVEGSTECVSGPFDLVAANLPWEVQVHKAPDLCRLAAADGRLILSGFRDNQEEGLQQRYRELGWRRRERLVKYFSHPELPPDISFNWVAWLLTAA